MTTINQGNNNAPSWFSLEHVNINSGENADSAKDFYQGLVSSKSPELKKAWEYLDKKYPDIITSGFKAFPTIFFWNLYNHGFAGPSEFIKRPISEINDLADEINQSIKTLNKIILLTGTDFPMTSPFNPSANKESYDDFMFSSLLDGWRTYALAVIGANRKNIKRPRSGNLNLRYFCIRMTMLFHRLYGSPMHAVTAAFASHIFNIDVDPDYVKKAVKN